MGPIAHGGIMEAGCRLYVLSIDWILSHAPQKTGSRSVSQLTILRDEGSLQMFRI